MLARFGLLETRLDVLPRRARRVAWGKQVYIDGPLVPDRAGARTAVQQIRHVGDVGGRTVRLEQTLRPAALRPRRCRDSANSIQAGRWGRSGAAPSTARSWAMALKEDTKRIPKLVETA